MYVVYIISRVHIPRLIFHALEGKKLKMESKEILTKEGQVPRAPSVVGTDYH